MAGYEDYINEDWTKESSFKLYSYWYFIEPIARAIRERSIVLNDNWWIFDKDEDNNLLLPVKLYNSDPTWDILEELHNQITNLIPQYLDINNTYKLDDVPCDGYKNWTEETILQYIGDTDREPYKLNKLDNIINIKWIIQSRKILKALKYIVIDDNGGGSSIQKKIIEKYKSTGDEDQDVTLAHWEWIGTTGALAFCDTYPEAKPDKFTTIFSKALQAWRKDNQDISGETSFDFYTKILFRQNAREDSIVYPPPSTVVEYWDRWQRRVYIESKYGKVQYTININTNDIPDDIDIEYEVFRCDCEENLLHKITEGNIDTDKSFIVEYPKKAPTLTGTGGNEPHNFFDGNNPYDPYSTDKYERERWASFPKTGLYERSKTDNYTGDTLTSDSCNYGIVVLLKPDFQFI